MPVREYQLKISADELLDKMFDALRYDTVVEDIIGEEAPGERAVGDGVRVRQFRLMPDTIERGDSLTVHTQDELTDEWLTISVGDDVVLQVVSKECPLAVYRLTFSCYRG